MLDVSSARSRCGAAGKVALYTSGRAPSVNSYRAWAQDRTGVQPKRQKLLGLKTKQGKMASDDVLVSDLALKAGQKIMMVG